MNLTKVTVFNALFLIFLSPLATSALPLNDATSALTAIRTEILNSTIAARQVYADDSDGRLTCVKTSNPNECTIRVAQFKFQEPYVDVYDADCNSLTAEWHPLGPHASIDSELPWTIELDFNSNYLIPPTGWYGGNPIGMQWNVDNNQWPICEGPWTPAPHTKIDDICCILPFTC